MTARYALRRRSAGVSLVTRPIRRVGLVLGSLLLLGGAVYGFDASVDLSSGRLLLTLLYSLALLSCLLGAASTRAVFPAPGELTMEHRLVWLRLSARVVSVPEGSEVRVSRLNAQRSGYVLEVGVPGCMMALDTSSWRSELEPMGREIALALRAPFVPADR